MRSVAAAWDCRASNMNVKPPAPRATAPAKSKFKPEEQTFEEPKYLKRLIEQRTPVCVKLKNNETVSGIIEFYDAEFIRLTRDEGPNLFVFKHDIKYLFENDDAGGSPRKDIG
jgi:sRNA-binding regulator protein Hfq